MASHMGHIQGTHIGTSTGYRTERKGCRYGKTPKTKQANKNKQTKQKHCFYMTSFKYQYRYSAIDPSHR